MDDGQQRSYPPQRELPWERQRALEQQQTLEQQQREHEAWLRQQEQERLLEQRRQEAWRDRPDHDLQERIEHRWTWRRWLGLDRRDALKNAAPHPRPPGGWRKPRGRRR